MKSYPGKVGPDCDKRLQQQLPPTHFPGVEMVLDDFKAYPRGERGSMLAFSPTSYEVVSSIPVGHVCVRAFQSCGFHVMRLIHHVF